MSNETNIQKLEKMEDLGMLVNGDLVYQIGGMPLVYVENQKEGVFIGRYGTTKKTFSVPLKDAKKMGKITLGALEFDMKKIETHPNLNGEKSHDFIQLLIHSLENSLIKERYMKN